MQFFFPSPFSLECEKRNFFFFIITLGNKYKIGLSCAKVDIGSLQLRRKAKLIMSQCGETQARTRRPGSLSELFLEFPCSLRLFISVSMGQFSPTMKQLSVVCYLCLGGNSRNSVYQVHFLQRNDTQSRNLDSTPASLRKELWITVVLSFFPSFTLLSIYYMLTREMCFLIFVEWK